MFSTDQAVLVQESLKASNSAIVATPMLKDPSTSKTAPGANTEVTQGSAGKTSASSAQLFTYLALLIMLVVVTILMVVFYIKRHREPHLYDATDTAGMQ
jgi:cobalamin biosynthesis Mg chelatase CobN